MEIYIAECSIDTCSCFGTRPAKQSKILLSSQKSNAKNKLILKKSPETRNSTIQPYYNNSTKDFCSVVKFKHCEPERTLLLLAIAEVSSKFNNEIKH